LRLYWLIFLPPVIYQLLAIVAALLFLTRRRVSATPTIQPPVSVLKPLRGLDPNTYPAFVSQVRQDYPQFEILFGVSDENDPAAEEVRRLQRGFPAAPIHLIVGGAPARNGKVGMLIELAEHASYPICIVNDSDIKVTPAYLQQVVAPLADPGIGLVTCLYRARAHTLAAAFEALGIATDFMPSTLVAQLLGVRQFGLGSTLAFRAADLESAGGFAAIADYLADDYQLAKRITASGKRALLSSYVVETSLGDSTWRGMWLHQLRWARTIRTSKGVGYAGLFITHAGIWMLLAVALHAPVPAICLAALRLPSALLTSGVVLRSRLAAALAWLSPVWDIFAFCIWIASYFGRTVRWRDRVLRIDGDGRILE
jgi:ceramide glucosyltransferase